MSQGIGVLEKASTSLCVGKITLDRSSKTATIGTRVATLGAREFECLELLMTNPNVLVPKTKFLEYLYPDMPYPPEGTLRVFMCHLRKKLDLEHMLYEIRWVKEGYVLSIPA